MPYCKECDWEDEKVLGRLTFKHMDTYIMDTSEVKSLRTDAICKFKVAWRSVDHGKGWLNGPAKMT